MDRKKILQRKQDFINRLQVICKSVLKEAKSIENDEYVWNAKNKNNVANNKQRSYEISIQTKKNKVAYWNRKK